MPFFIILKALSNKIIKFRFIGTLSVIIIFIEKQYHSFWPILLNSVTMIDAVGQIITIPKVNLNSFIRKREMKKLI